MHATIQFPFGGRWVDMSRYHTVARSRREVLRFPDVLAARDYCRGRIPANLHCRIATHTDTPKEG
ncbi:MAG: hypothetical protein JXA69_07655 [Phycisphaerae bacterium]|nr:hypothetical protein [Phycisphaerae bacterium]